MRAQLLSTRTLFSRSLSGKWEQCRLYLSEFSLNIDYEQTVRLTLILVVRSDREMNNRQTEIFTSNSVKKYI